MHSVDTASTKQVIKADLMPPEAEVEPANAVTDAMAAGLVPDPTLGIAVGLVGEVEAGVGDGLDEPASAADGRIPSERYPQPCINSA